MTKLALTLHLRDTEPPYFYVSRLAALNGSFFAQDFAFNMGVPWSSITNRDSVYIEKMARLASLRAEDLELVNILRTSDRCFRLARERMKGKTMMRKDIKVCPRCLAGMANMLHTSAQDGQSQAIASAQAIEFR